MFFAICFSLQREYTSRCGCGVNYVIRQVCRVGVYNFRWNFAREIVSARFGMIWTCRCAEWHKRTETRTVAAGSPTLPVGHAMSLKTLLFSSRSGMIAAATGLGLCVPLLSGCADDQQMAAQYVE